MNYIYDIVLNFQDYYYNFYEWKNKDKIKNIYKIPIYRVSNKDILIFKNNKVKIDKNFLNKIKKNMCLISNTKITIGLLFNPSGDLIKRSSLLYDEEEEANNIAKSLKETKIIFLENKKNKYQDKLRIEIEKKETILNYLNKITDPIVLKYLYYVYFKKEEENKEIKKILKKELEKSWSKNHNNLYQTINILNKKNLPIK